MQIFFFFWNVLCSIYNTYFFVLLNARLSQKHIFLIFSVLICKILVCTLIFDYSVLFWLLRYFCRWNIRLVPMNLNWPKKCFFFVQFSILTSRKNYYSKFVSYAMCLSDVLFLFISIVCDTKCRRFTDLFCWIFIATLNVRTHII